MSETPPLRRGVARGSLGKVEIAIFQCHAVEGVSVGTKIILSQKFSRRRSVRTDSVVRMQVARPSGCGGGPGHARA